MYSSLLDVAGGSGGLAIAITKACTHISFFVLLLRSSQTLTNGHPNGRLEDIDVPGLGEVVD